MSDGTAPAPSTAATRPAFSVSLSARDLMNVAIFAVLYIVVIFLGNMLGYIGPLVMLLALLASVLVAAVPFMLFLTRVKHAGMLTLFGAVYGLALALIGLGWAAFAVSLAVSVIGEVILWFGAYRSRAAAICTSAVFGLSSAGPFIPLILDREAYLSTAFAGMDSAYIEGADRLLSGPVLGAYSVGTLVCGLLGGLLGAALLKKHFVRAGLA